VGLRGTPRSFRGLRPRMRVSALESSRWFIGLVIPVWRSAGERQALTRKMPAIYILQPEPGGRKVTRRVSVTTLGLCDGHPDADGSSCGRVWPSTTGGTGRTCHECCALVPFCCLHRNAACADAACAAAKALPAPLKP
jgi:hypothetical protein